MIFGLNALASASLTCEPCVTMTAPPYNGIWLLEKDFNEDSGCPYGCQYKIKETGISMCRSPPNVPGPTLYSDCSTGSQTTPQPSVNVRECCPTGTVKDLEGNDFDWDEAKGGFVHWWEDYLILKKDNNGIWQLYNRDIVFQENTEEGCPFDEGREFYKESYNNIRIFTFNCLV